MKYTETSVGGSIEILASKDFQAIPVKVAEYLYGAEDIDAALTEIARAWQAKEKALKLEYGRLPAPGAGGANSEDAETQKALEMAKNLGQSRAANNKSIRDGLNGYIR